MDKCSTTKLPGRAGLKALHNTRQRQPPESFWMLSLRDVLFTCPLFKDPCVVYIAPVVNTVLTCSRKGHLDIVRYLVGEASCDLNARDTNGYTPLHTACRYNLLYVDASQSTAILCQCILLPYSPIAPPFKLVFLYCGITGHLCRRVHAQPGLEYLVCLCCGAILLIA